MTLLGVSLLLLGALIALAGAAIVVATIRKPESEESVRIVGEQPTTIQEGRS